MRVFIFSLVFAAVSYAAAPVIFFTDLISGPATGGESGNGAYVTIYGVNFGSSPSVTVGGGAVASIKVAPTTYLWYQKMTVQLGSSAVTGNLVVTTSGGTSNSIAFTVNSATIYFVSSTGSDSAAGTFAAPWLTLTHARDTMTSGSIVYVETGSYLTTDDGSGYSTCMKLNGEQGVSATQPNAMIAYPGETVNLGSSTNCGDVVRGQGSPAGNDENYWVFAGFAEVIGNTETFNPWDAHDWRIVGNANMTCPPGNNEAGCLDPSGDTDGDEYNYYFYGNDINHVGTANSATSVTPLYHGVYLSQNIHNLWFGWSIVSNVYGGRCIQENVNNNSSTDQKSSYGLHIHDNIIHDCPLDGIIFTYVNPSLGTVEAYNNVIYNAGQGPANPDNSGAWNCINAQGWINATLTESGVIELYNNTMYACGTFASPPYTGSSGGITWEAGQNGSGTTVTTKSVNVYNNATYLTTGDALAYIQVDGTAAEVTGSNNLWYNAGSTLSGTSITGSTFSNPDFTSTSTPNFTPLSGSPLIGLGTATGAPALDITGLVRPSPPSAGAYELAGAAPSGGGSSIGGAGGFGGKVIVQ